MKKYILLLLGIFLFSNSCQEKIPADLDEPDGVTRLELEPFIKAFNKYEPGYFDWQAGLKSGEPAERTLTKWIEFKSGSGTFSILPNMGFCDEFEAPLQLVVEGNGIATHLGLYTVLNQACLDMYGGYVSPVFGFITAACGSEIHTMMGAPYPDPENPPNFFYPYTIIGGTKKYENASGYFLMYGYIDFLTGQWNLTGEGEITY